MYAKQQPLGANFLKLSVRSVDLPHLGKDNVDEVLGQDQYLYDFEYTIPGFCADADVGAWPDGGN
eukprot:2163902-Lingulodinium_polyedra.AAC.1